VQMLRNGEVQGHWDISPFKAGCGNVG
jgi:hypothetical protein